MLQSDCAMQDSTSYDWQIWSPHSWIDNTADSFDSNRLRTSLLRPFNFIWPFCFIWVIFVCELSLAPLFCHMMFGRLCLYVQWVICLLHAVAVKTHSPYDSSYETYLCIYCLCRILTHFFNILGEPVLSLKRLRHECHMVCVLQKKKKKRAHPMGHLPSIPISRSPTFTIHILGSSCFLFLPSGWRNLHLTLLVLFSEPKCLAGPSVQGLPWYTVSKFLLFLFYILRPQREVLCSTCPFILSTMPCEERVLSKLLVADKGTNEWTKYSLERLGKRCLCISLQIVFSSRASVLSQYRSPHFR